MDPAEFLKELSYESLVDLGHDGTSRILPLSFVQQELGADLGIPDVEEAIFGLNLIHNEMVARGLKAEAHNLWDRVNNLFGEENPLFGGATYEEMNPAN